MLWEKQKLFINNEQFLHFPQRYLKRLALQTRKNKGLFGKGTSFLKTLGKKEKLLIMSNFSFSHSDFYLFGELSAIFIKSEIVICKLFQFGRV